ncbi:MAG: hypothetical protein IT440_07495 [Phycisphaeraceae bacterium]|nr:hypothetical protein [Phycisphaeraceae bacterium]
MEVFEVGIVHRGSQIDEEIRFLFGQRVAHVVEDILDEPSVHDAASALRSRFMSLNVELTST